MISDVAVEDVPRMLVHRCKYSLLPTLRLAAEAYHVAAYRAWGVSDHIQTNECYSTTLFLADYGTAREMQSRTSFDIFSTNQMSRGWVLVVI